jgi:hypothetical protein
LSKLDTHERKHGEKAPTGLRYRPLCHNRAKAVNPLKERGYQVHNFDADDYLGRPVLEVEAYKDRCEYDAIFLSRFENY